MSSAEGASIRVCQLANGLSTKGATVRVLHHGITKQYGNISFKHFKSCNLVTGISNYIHPLNPSYLRQLYNFIEDDKPDIVQCEGPWSMFPTVFIAHRFNIPCVLDEHNVEFLWSLNVSKVPFMAPSVFTLEKIAVASSALILSTSEIDKELLTKMYNVDRQKIIVIPNGVNSKLAKLSLTMFELRTKLDLTSKNRLVLFHGLMSARQNFEAAKLIIDIIAPKLIDTTFLIIGKDAPNWLKKKAEAQTNVHILGYVPNIAEYIAVANVCIAPLQRGSGTRLKVLEYLAAGKPIVATSKGVEGLGLINNFHCILHESVDDSFVESINRILNCPKLGQSLGKHAAELAKTFDWTSIAEKLYAAYFNLLSENKENWETSLIQ